MNTFDPVAHAYTIAGRPVPSVTTVLRDLIPGWSASEWYMQRGSVVHACAAMIARGVDFDFDPAVTMQVFALRHFFQQIKPTVVAVEQQVYSERYQYAGTLDLVAGVGGKEWLIDFKGTLGPAVPYQLAAYSLARGGPKLGVGVEIRPDGTYAMSEVYDLKRYQQGWLALLTAYGIRRQCNIKPEGEQK